MTNDSLFADLLEADQEALSGGVVPVQYLGVIRTVLTSVALPQFLNQQLIVKLNTKLLELQGLFG